MVRDHIRRNRTHNSSHLTKIDQKKAQWPEFRECSRQEAAEDAREWNELVRYPNKQNMDQAGTTITTQLKRAVDKCVPPDNPSPRSKLWWSEDIRRERKQLHSAVENWKVGKEEFMWENHKDQRRSFFRSIRTAKGERWDKF